MGSDEDAVRALSATLERFRGDPRQALGLAAGAGAADARRAFMDLCKQYHPAKFARYAPATVRLSNEVFLAIKRACETITAAPPPVVARPAHGQTTGKIPVIPLERPNTTPLTSRLAPPPAGARPRATPPTGNELPRRPATPTIPQPAPVPARPPAPAARPAAPAPTSPARPPSPTVQPVARPSTRTQQPLATPARPSGRATAAEVAGTVKARDRFEQALQMVREQKYAEARTAFAELAAEAPTDPRYRAYLHYTRGWEAFKLGKDGEARAEWQRALACDPGLGLAKWALESTGHGR